MAVNLPESEEIDLSLLTRPWVIAHRGFHHTGHQQNSVAAVEAAFRLGCEAAEVDLRLSADGRLALFHDGVWQHRPAESFTACELGGHLLLEALAATFDHEARLVIDVKEPTGPGPWAQLHDLLSSLPDDALDRLVVQTSDAAAAAGLISALPKLRLSLLVRRPTARTIVPTGLWGMSRQHVPVTTARVRADHLAGHRSIAWTVNSRRRMLTLLAAGVDGLITDRPDLLLDLLQTPVAPSYASA